MRFVYCLAMTIFLIPSLVVAKDNQAESLKKSLYQIQVIDIETDYKSVIGSGFTISSKHMVTNYHVVSAYVKQPEKYLLKYLHTSGEQGELSLVKFDVINDLAVVEFKDYETSDYLPLAERSQSSGTPAKALGNPHDLGFIMSEGVNNGLVATSFIPKLHFTGAINAGMSGGPAVNDSGQVIGINVARGGDNIGFLVPVESLKRLLTTSPVADYEAEIGKQLVEYQNRVAQELFANKWPVKELRGAEVIGPLNESVKCWGRSDDDEEGQYITAFASLCNLSEHIFVHDDLTTGQIHYEFRVVEARDISSGHFYSLMTDNNGMFPDNKAGKEQVTGYTCKQYHVTSDKVKRQLVVRCIRRYEKYPELYDLLVSAFTLDKDKKQLLSHMSVAGFNKENMQKMLSEFLEAGKWL